MRLYSITAFLVYCSVSAWLVSGQGADTCPAFSSVFDDSGVGDTVANWLTVDGTGGASFIAGLYHDYLTDDGNGPLTIAHGSELIDEASEFSICRNLPLNASDCYLATNPDSSFFRHIVANQIPMGRHIINAIEEVEAVVERFQEMIDDLQEQVLISKESGTCIVGNEKMVGIFESPGYPK